MERLLARGWARRLIQSHKARAVLAWLFVVGCYQVCAWHFGLTPVELLERIAHTMRTGYGPLIYIIVYALLPLILFPVSILSLLGGWIFGITWGIIYTLIGSSVSATVAYGVGRWFGRDMQLPDHATSKAGRWLHRMREQSFLSVLMLRLLFVPYDLVNYAAGCLRIRWLPFISASMIGVMPGMVAIILSGASIEGSLSDGQVRVQPWTIAVSIGIIMISIAVSRFIARRSTQGSAFDTLSTE